MIANFTGDAKPDVAVVNFGSADVSMFVNTTATPGGVPTFTGPTNFGIGGGNGRNTTAVADFDASGQLDLAVPKFGSSQVAVLLGDGLGVLGAASPFGTGTLTQYAAAGSLNGDSKPDLAAANYTSGNVSVLLNTTVAVGTATFAPKVDTVTGGGARAVAIGNFNGDANGDVAVVNESAQTLTVHRGNGDGTFQLPTSIAIGPGAAGVALGDVDADGRQDIAVSRSAGAAVLVGNGNGTFQPLIPLTGAGSSDVVIADVNGDAKPDVINDNSVFLNTTAPSGGGGGGGSGTSASTPVQTALPPPQARKTMNVAAVSGTVKIKQPGQRSFRTLGTAAQIRMGSIIDATDGRVRITTDAGGGKTQTAEFYDGVFKVTQTKGKKPVTDLTLVGKLAGCKKSGKATAAAKKRKGRRLWGNGKGRFRTKGKRSSALVRGTIWLVEDRCNDTTLTRVRRGVVRVRDFGRKRNITVRAGRSYVARKP